MHDIRQTGIICYKDIHDIRQTGINCYKDIYVHDMTKINKEIQYFHLFVDSKKWPLIYIIQVRSGFLFNSREQTIYICAKKIHLFVHKLFYPNSNTGQNML